MGLLGPHNNQPLTDNLNVSGFFHVQAFVQTN